MIKMKSSIRFSKIDIKFRLQKADEIKRVLTTLFKKEHFLLASLQYIFCDDEYLLNINQTYLKHNYYTDIISFDLSEGEGVVGEIYISIDRVKENALQYETGFWNELYRVIFHGALHLCGYNDKTPSQEKIMRKKEEEYLALLESNKPE